MTVIYGGPQLVSMAFEDTNEGLEQGELQGLSVSFLDEHTTTYIKFIVKVSDFQDKQVYYTGKGEHLKLVEFLSVNGLIEKVDNRINLQDNLPIEVLHEECQELGQVFYLYDKSGFSKLKIGEAFIIGSSSGLIKRVLAFVFGIIVLLLGVCSALLAVYSLFLNFRELVKTGHLPDLPNSVDSKIEGLKFIFGGRKKR